MSGDVLSDLLRTVRLRGTVFLYVEGVAPWSAQALAARDVTQAIMPGVEHMFEFHGVAEGTCWVSLAGHSAFPLAPGDVVPPLSRGRSSFRGSR